MAATVSNVEVIGNPLIEQLFWKLCRLRALTCAEERGTSRKPWPCRVLLIAKRANDFNLRGRRELGRTHEKLAIVASQAAVADTKGKAMRMAKLGTLFLAGIAVTLAGENLSAQGSKS